MRVGFIGTGSMGSILIESFITAHALLPSQIVATNRTLAKAEKLAEKYPGLQVAENNQSAVKKSNILFICVKPQEYEGVIREIRNDIQPAQMLISITSPVFLKDLEAKLPCKISKTIPSITNMVHSGATLIMFGERCTHEDKSAIFRLFSSIGTPIEINEELTRVSSDIVSCGPAFFSFLLRRFIDAAVEETGISRNDATFLTSQMIIGLGKLISEDKFTLDTLQQRVCVPGGVTGAGIAVLEHEMGNMFHHLFQRTQEKFSEDIHHVQNLFKSFNNT